MSAITTKHHCLVLLLAPLLLAHLPASTRAQQLTTSVVWGAPPGLPWDTLSVHDDSWAVLDRPIYLGRRGTVGEERRYHIRRTNLSVDRHGRVLNRLVTEGEYLRTLRENIAPGIWVESFEWQWFASGMAQGPEGHPVPAMVPSASKVSYRMRPGESDYVNPPGDFAVVADELHGLFFKILAVDATSFDALLQGLRDRLGDSLLIGQEVLAEPSTERFALASRDEGEQPTWYQLGELRVAVAGFSRYQGEPTALIRFSVEGSTVTQNVETAQVSMTSEGTEFFRGLMALSLTDGRIVSGSLWGPIPSVVMMGFAGQQPSETPTAAFLQQVTLAEVATDGMME